MIQDSTDDHETLETIDIPNKDTKFPPAATQVLTRLHEDVIPNMTDPLLLADRLTGALDGGGMLGMLALHAIFVLVTKHGLEYPEFYTRLYQLLQPTAFLVCFFNSL